MWHIPIGCFFRAGLTCLLVIYAHMTIAQTAVGLDQNFANSLTDMPSENLGVSGAFYVPVYSSVSMSQGKLRADFSVTLSIHKRPKHGRLYCAGSHISIPPASWWKAI